MYVHVYVCIYIYICVYMYTHVYTHDSCCPRHPSARLPAAPPAAVPPGLLLSPLTI